MKLVTGTASALLLAGAAFAISTGCSSGPANPNSSASRDRGFKSIEATVVNREKEMPGAGGGIQGNPIYYLEFEAREGEANTHYRFEVNQTQFNRYVEGTHVQLIIGDNRLRDIRPIR
jgi:hypothetical protein